MGDSQSQFSLLYTSLSDPSVVGSASSHVGGRFMGRKYLRLYTCPWLDLVGNAVNYRFSFLSPCKTWGAIYLGNQRWAWPKPIYLTSTWLKLLQIWLSIVVVVLFLTTCGCGINTSNWGKSHPSQKAFLGQMHQVFTRCSFIGQRSTPVAYLLSHYLLDVAGSLFIFTKMENVT